MTASGCLKPHDLPLFPSTQEYFRGAQTFTGRPFRPLCSSFPCTHRVSSVPRRRHIRKLFLLFFNHVLIFSCPELKLRYVFLAVNFVPILIPTFMASLTPRLIIRGFPLLPVWYFDKLSRICHSVSMYVWCLYNPSQYYQPRDTFKQ